MHRFSCLWWDSVWRLQQHLMQTGSVSGRISITHIVDHHLAHQISTTSLVRRSLILERAAIIAWLALSLAIPVNNQNARLALVRFALSTPVKSFEPLQDTQFAKHWSISFQTGSGRPSNRCFRVLHWEFDGLQRLLPVRRLPPDRRLRRLLP